MNRYIVALGLLSAAFGSPASAQKSFDVYLFDRNGGVCDPTDSNGWEFYANIGTEGFIYVIQTRAFSLEGVLVDMQKTSDGLAQFLVQDVYGDQSWYTLDPKGYFAQGKISDPRSVKANHRLSEKMVRCESRCIECD